MLSFLTGFIIALVAAVPAILLSLGGKAAEFKQRLKLWAIGLGVKFVIIGAGAYLVLTETELARIPLVAGVGTAWLLTFLFESYLLLRSR